jgi:hypothetical protein
MEKLLQEVGKDILPGVSYIDNFEDLFFYITHKLLK